MVYRVPVSRIPPDAYPLKVSLELSYALSDDGLRVEFLFTNEEPELDAHVSFGLHPGFAVSSVSDCKVLFPEGTYLRYYAPGNFLDGREEEIRFGGGEMPFDKAKLADSYLIGLQAVPRRVFVARGRKSRPSDHVRLFRSSVSYALDRHGDLYLCRALLGIAGQQSSQAF